MKGLNLIAYSERILLSFFFLLLVVRRCPSQHLPFPSDLVTCLFSATLSNFIIFSTLLHFRVIISFIIFITYKLGLPLIIKFFSHVTISFFFLPQLFVLRDISIFRHNFPALITGTYILLSPFMYLCIFVYHVFYLPCN